jgi:hypothetical protein
MQCFSVDKYVIYFRDRNPVEILRILHGAQDVGLLDPSVVRKKQCLTFIVAAGSVDTGAAGGCGFVDGGRWWGRGPRRRWEFATAAGGASLPHSRSWGPDMPPFQPVLNHRRMLTEGDRRLGDVAARIVLNLAGELLLLRQRGSRTAQHPISPRTIYRLHHQLVQVGQHVLPVGGNKRQVRLHVLRDCKRSLEKTPVCRRRLAFQQGVLNL